MSYHKCSDCNYNSDPDNCESDCSDHCLCIQPQSDRNHCSCSEAEEIYIEPIGRYTNWNKKFEYLRKMWSYHGRRRKMPMAKCEYWEKPRHNIIQCDTYCEIQNDDSECSIRSFQSFEELPNNCQYRDDFCKPAPRCYSAQSERAPCRVYEQNDCDYYIPQAKETQVCIQEKLRDSSTQSDSQSTDSKQTQVSMLEKFSFIPRIEIPRTSKQTQYSKETIESEKSGSKKSRDSIKKRKVSEEIIEKISLATPRSSIKQESSRNSRDSRDSREYIEESMDSSESKSEETPTASSSESKISSQDTRVEEIKKIAETIISQTIRKYSEKFIPNIFPPSPEESRTSRKILTPEMEPIFEISESTIPPLNKSCQCSEIELKRTKYAESYTQTPKTNLTCIPPPICKPQPVCQPQKVCTNQKICTPKVCTQSKNSSRCSSASNNSEKCLNVTNYSSVKCNANSVNCPVVKKQLGFQKNQEKCCNDKSELSSVKCCGSNKCYKTVKIVESETKNIVECPKDSCPYHKKEDSKTCPEVEECLENNKKSLVRNIASTAKSSNSIEIDCLCKEVIKNKSQCSTRSKKLNSEENLCLTKALFIKTIPQCCIFENPNQKNQNFTVNNMFIEPESQKQSNKNSSNSNLCLENIFLEKSSCNCCEKCDLYPSKPKTASFDARKTSKIPTICKRTTSQSSVKFKCCCNLEKCTCNNCSVIGDTESAKLNKSILKLSTCDPKGDSNTRKSSAKSFSQSENKKCHCKTEKTPQEKVTDTPIIEIMSAIFISSSELASEQEENCKNDSDSNIRNEICESSDPPTCDIFGERQSLLHAIQEIPSNMFSDVPDVQFTLQGFGPNSDVLRILKVKNLLGRCNVDKKIKNWH